MMKTTIFILLYTSFLSFASAQELVEFEAYTLPANNSKSIVSYTVEVDYEELECPDIQGISSVKSGRAAVTSGLAIVEMTENPFSYTCQNKDIFSGTVVKSGIKFELKVPANGFLKQHESKVFVPVGSNVVLKRITQ